MFQDCSEVQCMVGALQLAVGHRVVLGGSRANSCVDFRSKGENELSSFNINELYLFQDCRF